LGARTTCLWLSAMSLVGLLMVGGCTRDKPLPTPTPTPPVEEVLVTPSASATPPPEIAPVVPEVTYHTVQAGDTAWGIAEQYGVTLEALIAANELSDPNSLQPGDRLVIPNDEDTSGEDPAPTDSSPESAGQNVDTLPRTHTVGAGDTLWSIALEYDVGVDEIARLNGLDPEGILTLGQELQIP
jgi:LysM repeat protein